MDNELRSFVALVQHMRDYQRSFHKSVKYTVEWNHYLAKSREAEIEVDRESEAIIKKFQIGDQTSKLSDMFRDMNPNRGGGVDFGFGREEKSVYCCCRSFESARFAPSSCCPVHGNHESCTRSDCSNFSKEEES